MVSVGGDVAEDDRNDSAVKLSKENLGGIGKKAATVKLSDAP
jgi:hypothetical protein